MKAPATIDERGVRLERVEENDVASQRRPLTQRISRRLFFVVGVGFTAAVVCMVVYRTGSGTEVPWKYLAIAFGNTTAVVGFLACFMRAMDEIR